MMGFDGLLLSDDLTMKALEGSPGERAKKALAAGSDIVLWCQGSVEEMEEVAAVLPPMSEEAHARWQRAQEMVKTPAEAYNSAADIERLDILLGAVAFQVKSVG
jgi:beta-N-acetylhexosaminidase